MLGTFLCIRYTRQTHRRAILASSEIPIKASFMLQNCLKEIKKCLARWRISYLQAPPNLYPCNIYASQKEVSTGHLEWHTAPSPWYCKYLGMNLDRRLIYLFIDYTFIYYTLL